MSNISRRDMFKLGGLSVLGATSLAAFSGATMAQTAVASPADSELPFFVKPEPITDVADVRDYDVVVIGAGAAGVPAAISAMQAGAKVALLQKEANATSQGNTCQSIVLEESSPAGVEAVISMHIEENAHQPKREQAKLWAYNSGEALKWLWDIAQEAGAQTVETTEKWTGAIQQVNGYDVKWFTFDFGPKPYNTGNGMRDICDWAEGQGLEIFYSTPAVQLVQDGEGAAVTGVIAEGEDGYIQFNAAKGVIVATGDYENDDEMMAHYEPRMANIYRKEVNKTGDGQKMMVWAGGIMEDSAASKVLHDFDAGPGSMADMPFLCVKNDGTRFCDESRSSMATMANFLLSEEDAGWYSQIFDSNYMTDTEGWPGVALPPEAMANYMPEIEGEKSGVYEGIIRTYSADTLEELAEKLEITDVDAFVATVERYNELVEAGADEDMGKSAQWLKAIAVPPFYGIHRHIGLSTLIHGVNVDENMQVLNADGEPIECLYSIGNCAGNFFGHPDYPLTIPGLSLGRAHTQGYVVGRAVASK